LLPAEKIMEGFWPLLSNRAGLVGTLRRSSVLREHPVRKLVVPNSCVSLPGNAASGKSREVEVYQSFRAVLASEGLGPAEAQLIETLAGYE